MLVGWLESQAEQDPSFVPLQVLTALRAEMDGKPPAPFALAEASIR